MRTSVMRRSCRTLLTKPTPWPATVASKGTGPAINSSTLSRKAGENDSILPTSSSTMSCVSGSGVSASSPIESRPSSVTW